VTVRDPWGAEIPAVLLPRGVASLYRRPRIARYIAKHFARVYYANPERTMFAAEWLGTRAFKYPTDMWVYQELIARLRPELVIETGTYYGGSAMFFGSLMDLLGEGEVVSIDISDNHPPAHPRVTYLLGSSVSPEIMEEVARRVAAVERVIVILDSDHSRKHVLAELRAYADFVPVGSYLIVEDTNVNGHPVLPQHGEGPYEAVRDFLGEDDRFVIDRSCEKFFLTANPDGFLRRIG
jgi:cephalosporin hydroxylase